MDLEQAIAFLMGQDRNAVVNALMTKAQPLYQAIFDKGHGSATAAKQSAIEAADAARVSAERARDAEKERADDLQAKLQEAQPERAKVDEQWRRQLDETKEQHRKEITRLNGLISTERLARAKSDLKSRLTSSSERYGNKVVDPLMADVLVEHPDNLKRFRFGNDGTLEILQAGKDIPLQVGDGQLAIDLFAQELKNTVDPRFVQSGADRGAETPTQPSSGSQGGSYYERLRANLKNERESGEKKQPSGAERMGMSKTGT